MSRRADGEMEEDDAPIPMPPDSVRAVGGPATVRMDGDGKSEREVTFVESNAQTERFAPGRVLGGRYLIMGRLGEGAMGEVFRAEDRRLGGQVALKFLAPHASADAEGMRRLLTEARLARQITHPNVCRVFDVGDVEGMTFISMEYIDGETFASLLKRIGRLPPDKALSVAHQICAGLSWAHDRGILHRDLKPANIMLDGNGEVKIADFGLAGLADDLRRDRHRAGTPAYMSPEQLKGEGISLRSDIYSLGLVLYELFTGKAVYRPSSIQELMRLHDQPIESPSAIVPELDPAIDRVISLCLEKDPKLRPGSVREVAAMLPGGNVLEAALMAGQTPSPRQVAAAGETGLISVRAAAVLTGVFLLVVGLGLWLGDQCSLLSLAPLTKSPEVLADKAEEILTTLGFETAATAKHRAYAYDLYEEYMDLIRSSRSPLTAEEQSRKWEVLRMARPAPIDFWFRTSPHPLVTVNPNQIVTVYDPPLTVGGMVMVRLDPRGRLRELQYCTSPEIVGAESGREPSPDPPLPLVDSSGKLDAARLFGAAGLDVNQFTPIEPVRVPAQFADQRLAWDGIYSDSWTKEHVRVEAALYAKHLVSFRIVEVRWVAASMQQLRDLSSIEIAGIRLTEAVNAVVISVGAGLAWLNIRQRRGDRAGATRVAVLMFVATFLCSTLEATRPGSAVEELHLVCRAVEISLPGAMWFWIVYIALEPYVRRTWPQTLISWTRLVNGDVNDPLVGLHVALGGLCGVGTAVVAYVHRMSPPWIGRPPGTPWIDMERGVDVLQGTVFTVGSAFGILPFAAQFSISFLMALIIVKLIVRKRWLAAGLYACVQTVIWGFTRGETPLSWVFMAVVGTACTLVLTRLGLLAMVSGVVFFTAMTSLAASAEMGRWYSTAAVIAVGALIVTFGLGLGLAAGLMVPRRGTDSRTGSAVW